MIDKQFSFRYDSCANDILAEKVEMKLCQRREIEMQKNLWLFQNSMKLLLAKIE